jgi:hypothetical protein
MQIAAVRLIDLKDGISRPIVCEVVRAIGEPTVKDKFVPVLIIAESDHELLLNPDQRLSKGEAALIQSIDKIREERTGRHRRITSRSGERPTAGQLQCASKSCAGVRRKVVYDGPLDAIAAIGLIQVGILRCIFDPIRRIRPNQAKADAIVLP